LKDFVVSYVYVVFLKCFKTNHVQIQHHCWVFSP